MSGFDRFAGIEGLRGNCNIRSATTDKLRMYGVRTSVPALLKYPIHEDSQGFQRSLLDMFYGNDLFAKLKGVYELARYSLTRKS